MARYIKANKKVAEYLDLTRDRNRLPDGNYLLWQADMLKFGRLTELSEICARIGAIALQPHEARQEQDGTVTRELPTATDGEFAMPVAAEEEPQAATETGTGQQPAGEEEQPETTVEEPQSEAEMGQQPAEEAENQTDEEGTV